MHGFGRVIGPGLAWLCRLRRLALGHFALACRLALGCGLAAPFDAPGPVVGLAWRGGLGRRLLGRLALAGCRRTPGGLDALLDVLGDFPGRGLASRGRVRRALARLPLPCGRLALRLAAPRCLPLARTRLPALARGLAAALGSALTAGLGRATALLVAGDGVGAISGRLDMLVVATSDEPHSDLERELHKLEIERERGAGNGKQVHQSSWESSLGRDRPVPAAHRVQSRAASSPEPIRRTVACAAPGTAWRSWKIRASSSRAAAERPVIGDQRRSARAPRWRDVSERRDAQAASWPGRPARRRGGAQLGLPLPRLALRCRRSPKALRERWTRRERPDHR